MRQLIRVFCVVALAQSSVLLADPSNEAQALLDEALAILKINSQREAPPEQTAQVILKLEKAQQILEVAKIDQGALPELVSNTLFWTRRLSNIQVINALDKLRASSGQTLPLPPIKKTEPSKLPEEQSPEEIKDAPPPEIVGLTAAKKAFNETDQFVKSCDDYNASLAWFRMANEHSGNDYALKALELARAAQTRFAAKIAAVEPVKEEIASAPEIKLIQDGDALAQNGKYEESVALYKSSLALKETILGHRKIADAYYQRGRQMKEELLPKYESAAVDMLKEYKNAFEIRQTLHGQRRKVFRHNYPPYMEAKRKYEDLRNQGLKAIAVYDQAASEYRAILRMSPNNKNLDAAGHVGICMAVRGETLARINARQYLIQFLADYTPTNDLERSLYEFCKTELNRINTQKKK